MGSTGSGTHGETIQWIDQSAANGRKWFVCLDEFGGGSDGVRPDSNDYWHDNARKNCLWGNLMAGGAGCEWYFGYPYAHNDLNCEDWRSRDHMWDLTRYALDFFHSYLDFTQMAHNDGLTSASGDYCLANPGDTYVIYLPNGGTTDLNLTGVSGTFEVKWFDPRYGGALQDGTVTSVTGGSNVNIGYAPNSTNSDWTCLVRPSGG